MKKLSVSVLAISLLAILCHAPVFAFNCANSFTFTFGDSREFFASKRHIRNAWIPYGIVGYNFTDEWGIEALLGIFNTDFKRSAGVDKEISGTLFAIDGIYHFSPCKNIQPFVLAGVGITGLSPNRFDANNEGNINAGVGLQIFANPIVAFRLEARDFYTITGGKNDIFVGAGVTFILNLC